MAVIALAAVSCTMQFGIPNMVSLAYRERFSHLLRFGDIALSVNEIVIIGLAVAVMLAVHALLRYTRLGKAMRATAANPMLARNCGNPTNRVIDAVWLITGSLCG